MCYVRNTVDYPSRYSRAARLGQGGLLVTLGFQRAKPVRRSEDFFSWASP